MRTKLEADARSEDMKARYLDGQTLAEIGTVHGVSRERVRQILSITYGINSASGGARVRSQKRIKQIKKTREERLVAATGMTVAERRKLYEIQQKMLREGRGLYQTPAYAFRTQRNNARLRKIEWKLTLKEWWDVWEKSKKWDKRGVHGESYVMCRKGDKGAYETGNVYIATSNQNKADGRTFRKMWQE